MKLLTRKPAPVPVNVLVDLSNIVAFKAEDKTVLCYLVDGTSTFLMPLVAGGRPPSLTAIEKHLVGQGFIRCHKSWLVAKNHISEHYPNAKAFDMSSGLVVEISRRFHPKVKYVLRGEDDKAEKGVGAEAPSSDNELPTTISNILAEYLPVELADEVTSRIIALKL